MTTLTTSALSTEVLESALLTLDQINTRLTVLALNASRNPQQSPRVWSASGVSRCKKLLLAITLNPLLWMLWAKKFTAFWAAITAPTCCL